MRILQPFRQIGSDGQNLAEVQREYAKLSPETLELIQRSAAQNKCKVLADTGECPRDEDVACEDCAHWGSMDANIALREMTTRNSNSARMHRQEQEKAESLRIRKAREERSAEMARYL